MNKKMSEEELLLYIEENYEILSLRKMSRDSGHSRKKITKIMEENSFKKEDFRLSQDKIDYILEFSDKTSTALAKELDIPASTIRGVWNRHGIKKKHLFNPCPIEFVEMYDKEKSSRKIAEHYGVSNTTVLNFAKEIGYVNVVSPILTESQIEHVISSYENKSAMSLSKELDVSESTVSKIWMESGLRDKKKNRYRVNEDYFEEIDTKEKAYWLGWLAADGCLHRRGNTYSVKLSLHSKDKAVLDMLNKALAHEKPVTRTLYRNKDVSTVEIVSEKMFNDLIAHGITPQKTWTYRLTLLDNELMSHFMRGFFDGDGSIFNGNQNMLPSSYGVSISGNIALLGEIKQYLETQGLASVLVEDKRVYTDKFGALIFRDTSEKYCFLKWLYKDSDIFRLERKRCIAEEFIALVESNSTNKSTNTRAVEKYNDICRL